MKKRIKTLAIILTVLVLSIVLDIISIYYRNKPIFAIKVDCWCNDQIYKGLLYDTYNCDEYSSPQIKAKWSNFSCGHIDFNKDTED